jgi:hypothetical protein
MSRPFSVSRSTQLIALVDGLGLGIRGFIASTTVASRYLILAASVYYPFLSQPVCFSSANRHSPCLFESYTLHILLLLEMDITFDVALNYA